MTVQRFDDLETARTTLIELLGEARHEVFVASSTLPRTLFDDLQVIDALKRFALSSPHARVHLQIADIRHWRTDGHRWLPLIQRIPSRFEFRTLVEDYWARNGFTEHFVFADRSLAWCCQTEHPLLGFCNHEDPQNVKIWRDAFAARARFAAEPSVLRRL
ncbi:hypothetical protein NFC81_13405 [Salinispirillum sp. LH 10-3-1]|uniref:DUF7931 domain-containing protein n=1 Tax=Salinispirillum sp. LH 10-3-1 TaxID=2952525 RepID=A0AB38YEN1_9GAMM